jgi:hypothetical protein
MGFCFIFQAGGLGGFAGASFMTGVVNIVFYIVLPTHDSWPREMSFDNPRADDFCLYTGATRIINIHTHCGIGKSVLFVHAHRLWE